MEVNILERSTGLNKTAVIEPMTDSDYCIVSESGQFAHDWHRYTQGYDNFKVFKIRISGTNELLGIMGINDSIVQGWERPYEIYHIELSKENQGKNKKFNYVAGCLISYACRESINRIDSTIEVFDGRIVLQPLNNKLKIHYCSTYNMIDAGSDGVESTCENGKQLIEKYFNLKS